MFGLAPKVPAFNVQSTLDDVVRYKPRDGLTIQGTDYDQAIETAWKQEKALIQQTGQGTRPWTQAEMDLIISTPDDALRSTMTKNHITNEQNGNLGANWQGDPRNIVFLQNGRNGTVNEHLYSYQGHRGSWGNSTTGRLVDREATLRQRLNQQQNKCG